MSDFAVELQDVVKRFPTPEGGEVFAVNHVTMQIKDGEFFSSVGFFWLWEDNFPAGCSGIRVAYKRGKFSFRVAPGTQPAFSSDQSILYSQNYALFPAYVGGTERCLRPGDGPCSPNRG